ncbi:MAG: hypothetical protein LBE20_06960 [Deltaproteobacteria bacterium]|jgi:hypothetical protein|nr:hypothetical protein [Deltaproteobacteria bacterium]
MALLQIPCNDEAVREKLIRKNYLPIGLAINLVQPYVHINCREILIMPKKVAIIMPS